MVQRAFGARRVELQNFKTIQFSCRRFLRVQYSQKDNKHGAEGLSTADKHLLSHLSPYEMRTVLISTPEVAEEVLDAVRPSFAQRENAFASNESYFSFIGHMMEAAVLPPRLRKPIAHILKSFSQVPLVKSMGATFEDSFDSSSSFAQRLNRFRQVPSTEEVLVNRKNNHM